MHVTMNGCLGGNTYSEPNLHFNPTYYFGGNNIDNDGCIYNPH